MKFEANFWDKATNKGTPSQNAYVTAISHPYLLNYPSSTFFSVTADFNHSPIGYVF